MSPSRWILIAMLLASLWGGWNWFTRERHVSVPPGVVVPGDPIQTMLEPPPKFTAKDHVFTARAQFDITARILRRENYHVDGGAHLAPVDLAVGWGPMSDSRVLDLLKFSQMGRYLSWSMSDWSKLPITPQDMITHAGQIHAIPANAKIDAALHRLRPGQVVRLTGYLVDVDGPRGFTWRTSLTRLDSGNNACEVMWIDSLEVE